MLTFLHSSRNKQPPRVPARLNTVKNNIFYNYKRITRYWRDMNWTVRSDHILVGILNGLSSSTNEPSSNYRIARDVALTYTSPRGIVSPVNYGKVQFKSNFYGHECQEILIEQPFDDAIEQLFTKHYSEWDPVRVVYHPFTSFDYQLPNNKRRLSEEKGICIIKIDIGLLFAQYKAWRNDKLASQYDEETSKSVMNFIHSYPITNMMKSHLETVWFNRLKNRYFGVANSDNKSDTRLAMSSSYYHVDEVHDDIIRYLNLSRGSVQDFACWIPGIFTNSLKDFLMDDTVMNTHQNRLAKYLAEVPYLSLLFGIDFKIESKASGMERNEYIRKFKIMNSGKLFSTIRNLDYDTTRNYFIENINIYTDNI